MRKAITIIVFTISVLINGCENGNQYAAQIDLLSAQKDSLRIEIVYLKSDLTASKAQIDSLTVLVDNYRQLSRATAWQCENYAKIVRNNPSQSVFIVNWIKRSFNWLDEI